VCHVKWWHTNHSADDGDVFYMFAEMGNGENTEMLLKFPDSPHPTAFVTRSKVGGTGLSLIAPNDAFILQKFWVLNKPCQAFAQAVQLGQNRVPH